MKINKRISKWLLPFFILVIVCGNALAVPPQTISYQAYLKDNFGLPVNATENVTFRLYSVETGGTALWSDTLNVTITDGLFSVELGTVGNPLPKSSMDSPLWLGVEINNDGEAVPRKTLNSVNNAFRAEDSDRLEGLSAASLDQSAHVTDTANPHSVTAAQTGAATTALVSAHTGDAANPHSVTAVQVGAVTAADITTHTSDATAHHSRYSDPESIAAMGVWGDANALNHDKYTDANTVAAVLSADGAGSTLDADLVDGLHAAEIIDAAQDEVRTPISSLPFIISTSGSYYLTGNLNGDGFGININANDVTVDLMGFTLDGSGATSDYGFYLSGYSNVSIINGTIKGFGRAGIYQGSNVGVRHATVMDVKALGNGTSGGTGGSYSGIYLNSSNSHVERCTAGDNAAYGIFAYKSSKLINNTAYNNAGDYGIYGGSGSNISGNTAYNNTGTYGIYGGSGSRISGNTAYENTGTYGIYGLNGSSIIDNTVYINYHWGIYAAGSNLIKDNTLYFNNNSNTANEGGLHVGYDSRVIGNTLDSNKLNNLYVNSSDNLIRDNHVTDSGNGIFFNAWGNYYRDNTAAGNTTDFNLNGTTQTNGGGNVSF